VVQPAAKHGADHVDVYRKRQRVLIDVHLRQRRLAACWCAVDEYQASHVMTLRAGTPAHKLARL